MSVGYELDDGSWIFGIGMEKMSPLFPPPPSPSVASIPAVVSTKLYMQRVREQILPRKEKRP